MRCDATKTFGLREKRLGVSMCMMRFEYMHGMIYMTGNKWCITSFSHRIVHMDSALKRRHTRASTSCSDVKPQACEVWRLRQEPAHAQISFRFWRMYSIYGWSHESTMFCDTNNNGGCFSKWQHSDDDEIDVEVTNPTSRNSGPNSHSVMSTLLRRSAIAIAGSRFMTSTSNSRSRSDPNPIFFPITKAMYRSDLVLFRYVP